MLIDGKFVEVGSRLRAEFCIIGSGMGGATLATKLATLGRQVLLVEAGGAEKHRNEISPLAPSEHIGRSFGRLTSRAIELGGTSNLWHGICAPFDGPDFEPRPWIPGSGWPLRFPELGRYYDDAADVLGVLRISRIEAAEIENSFRVRLADITVKHNVLESKIFQLLPKPKQWKKTLLELIKRDKIQCLVHAAALELIVDEDGHTVIDVIVGVSGGTVKISARTFVICAGALETPRILLNSRRQILPGIGNRYDLVGRNLLDHPIGPVGKLKLYKSTHHLTVG